MRTALGLLLAGFCVHVWAEPTGQEPIQVIAAQCIACHGTEGLSIDSRFHVPKLTNQKSRYIENALLAYKSGRRSSIIMQLIATALNDKDIRAVAESLGDTQHGTSQERGAEYSEKVRALPSTRVGSVPGQIGQQCGSCHGDSGGGELPEIPVLAGQYADYLSYALEEYQAGHRNNGLMNPFARDLTANDIRELADYFSGETAMPFALSGNLAAKLPVSDISAPSMRAKPPKPLTTRSQVLDNLDMVDIPAGTFDMGDDQTEGFAVGSPKHQVTLAPFRLGKFEVTFQLYDAFARATHRPLPDSYGWGRSSRPVINVTFEETLAFIDWINRGNDRHFRLPSEAEYEYAGRARSTTVYWWGNDFRADYVNAYGTNVKDKWPTTAPVGQFPANSFGLYDMSGNVFVRVADCWHNSYAGAPVDGSAWDPASCATHVIRGGSWNVYKRPLRSSARSRIQDNLRSLSVGFRLAEDPPGERATPKAP